MRIIDNTNIAQNLAVETQARIAVYDDMLATPRIIDIEPAPVLEFIESIATKTYEFSHAQGGSLPYMVIREIVENFIHANFTECTVSVLDGGNTLRFSDQGPGIEKKTLVLQPGVTSATTQMKQFIKGVGSGFPIVREYLGHSHGYMSIDDNAAAGTVITLVSGKASTEADGTLLSENLLHETTAASPFITAETQPKSSLLQNREQPRLSSDASPQAPSPQKRLLPREEQALLLLLERGMLGPSELSQPLKVSAPTATRVLQKLEQAGMVETSQLKKRILSNAGLAYVQQLSQK